jgi:hypothetical protein
MPFGIIKQLLPSNQNTDFLNTSGCHGLSTRRQPNVSLYIIYAWFVHWVVSVVNKFSEKHLNCPITIIILFCTKQDIHIELWNQIALEAHHIVKFRWFFFSDSIDFIFHDFRENQMYWLVMDCRPGDNLMFPSTLYMLGLFTGLSPLSTNFPKNIWIVLLLCIHMKWTWKVANPKVVVG